MREVVCKLKLFITAMGLLFIWFVVTGLLTGLTKSLTPWVWLAVSPPVILLGFARRVPHRMIEASADHHNGLLDIALYGLFSMGRDNLSSPVEVPGEPDLVGEAALDMARIAGISFDLQAPKPCWYAPEIERAKEKEAPIVEKITDEDVARFELLASQPEETPCPVVGEAAPIEEIANELNDPDGLLQAIMSHPLRGKNQNHSVKGKPVGTRRQPPQRQAQQRPAGRAPSAPLPARKPSQPRSSAPPAIADGYMDHLLASEPYFAAEER